MCVDAYVLRGLTPPLVAQSWKKMVSSSSVKWAAALENIPSGIYVQRNFKEACASAQSGQGLHYQLEEALRFVTVALPGLFSYLFLHYENTPIQMYWKFHHRKLNIFFNENSDIFIFLPKT